MLIALTVLLIAAEAMEHPSFKIWAGLLGVAYLACVVAQVRWSRRAFVGIGIVLSAFALATRDDVWVLLGQALAAGGFVIGFFIALSTLRAAAGSSGSIRRCGLFLATRTPGKRYLALAAGGHLFSLVLNYGSISLLGTLVEQAEIGPDGMMRNHVRLRRCLDYLGRELDTYKSEMVLLYMAGFIGKLGGALAAPLVTTHLVDFSVVPGWAALAG